ncbi:MAG TPA: ABC transporter permease subunit [Thermoleophilia bacterium]|nr:ABC transporter permease subunit [Thermoleophilia bacterium]
MSHLRREIVKLLFQRRTYVGWLGLLAIPVIMTIALRLSSEQPPEGHGPPFFSNIAGNGLFVPLAALAFLSFFLLPLVSAMTGGFVIAGEAETGTLKTLLTRPVTRGRVLLAKWFVAVLYVGVGLALVGVGGAVAGGLIFGFHPLTTLSGGQLGMAQSLGTIALAYLIVLAGMTCIVSLAVALSTLTDSSLTAAVGTLVIVLILEALGQFSYFDFLKPYLFTSHNEDWFNLLRQPVSWRPIWEALLTYAAYIVVLVGVAVTVFRRKDILS